VKFNKLGSLMLDTVFIVRIG